MMNHGDFVELFPDDDACLAFLKERFYSDGTACPRCHRRSRFHRLRGRSAFSCQFCGGQVYPAAGTAFHRSRTGLQLWFWAIFLVASTRGRVTARELERELVVSRKTADRMLMQIRDLLFGRDGFPEHPTTAQQPRWHRIRRRH